MTISSLEERENKIDTLIFDLINQISKISEESIIIATDLVSETSYSTEKLKNPYVNFTSDDLISLRDNYGRQINAELANVVSKLIRDTHKRAIEYNKAIEIDISIKHSTEETERQKHLLAVDKEEE